MAQTSLMAKRLLAGTLVAVMGAAVAPPVAAQIRGLRGTVVNEAGEPVEGAEVVLVLIGGARSEFSTKTNDRGEWVYAGIPADFLGNWNIVATKDNLVGRLSNVQSELGTITRVGEIVLARGAAGAALDAVRASAEDNERRNAEIARLNNLLKNANADVDAGNYDAAIAKIQEIIGDLEACAMCHQRLGDIYRLKGDVASAEEHYLASIGIDSGVEGPYLALATIYNAQRRFAEAGEMNQKANEIIAGSGGAADPVSIYNQGIILWNQGKIAEAKASFEQALQGDPQMANAHYYYGMALVNEGDLAGARTYFEAYLKLEPTGENAETAKALLSQIP